MLKLKELYLNNIGRFVGEQRIDFLSLGNLIQVDGQNNNTGGSSGSGKTTIFNALDYLLGLNDLPNSVLQSRLTKDGMSVTGIFDLDGRELSIIRGKSKFAIALDGEVISGSSKLTEEKLDQILAMPRNLFRQILHKRQKEGGFFLQMVPSKMHEFLVDCSGLSDILIKIEKIDLKLKELDEQRLAIECNVESTKASIAATDDAILALGSPPEKTVEQSTVLELKQKFEQSLYNLNILVAKHTEEENELERNRPIARKQEYDLTKLQQIKEDLKLTNDNYDILRSAETKRAEDATHQLFSLKEKATELKYKAGLESELIKKASTIALEIEKIRNHTCPICEQNWHNESSKKTEADLLSQVSNLKIAIIESRNAALEFTQVNAKIEEIISYSSFLITDEIKYLENKLIELQSLISEEQEKERKFNSAAFYAYNIQNNNFADLQREIKKRHSQEKSQLEGQVNLDKKSLDMAINAMSSYAETKERYNKTLVTLALKKEEFVQKFNSLVESHTSFVDKIRLAEETKKVIKSYTSCSFDDSLQTISDTATRIVRNIPNMANATIQLEGLKETKEGKIKEEVNAIINMDCEIGIPIKSLSGGERSSVDLSIDLAVIDLIEQKTGKGIDLFILDEPFTGLDSVSIEMALEVLKNSNMNKRIVIVDHNETVKEMVDNRVLVSRDGLNSRIIQ